MKRRIVSIIRMTIIILVLTLVALEILLRIAFPRFISYEEEVGRALFEPERLYAANTSMRQDATGLYESAGEINFHVGEDRFIDPVGDPAADYQVLFLGGSTTEALYVAEDRRWVAALADADIATYNAGVSGSNILDKYYAFEYFTDRGWTFDLVVISTPVNDLSWLFRLDAQHRELRIEEYRQGLVEWHAAEFASERTLLDQIGQYSRVVRMITTLVRNAQNDRPVAEDFMAVGEDYRAFDGEWVPLEACGVVDGIPVGEVIERYQANARTNLQLLADAVHAAGAKLLVMSESTSLRAPSDSFLVDLRPTVYRECSNGRRLSFEGLDELYDIATQDYLEAGCLSADYIFDLRQAMAPYSDGPEGGSYLYDIVHYTARGSDQVAELLRPVIRTILMDSETYSDPCESLSA